MANLINSNFGNVDSGILALARKPQTRTLTHRLFGEMIVKVSLWTRKVEDSVKFALTDDGMSGLADSSVLSSLTTDSSVAIKFVFTQTVDPRKDNVVDQLASQRREDKAIKVDRTRVFWVSLKDSKFFIGDMIEITVKDNNASFTKLANDTELQPGELGALIARAIKQAKTESPITPENTAEVKAASKAIDASKRNARKTTKA